MTPNQFDMMLATIKSFKKSSWQIAKLITKGSVR